jgi:putative SOS response-associated peptidase YedK
MCGRYVTKVTADYEREFHLREFTWPAGTEVTRYNVAPTQSVPVIRMQGGGRSGSLMRWGLVPFFARGVPPKYSTINARIETIETAPSYRGPWKRGQRCLVPALGFYEWHLDELGRKGPFFIKDVEHEYFGIAGLWDSSQPADGSPPVESCTLITMPANELMASIHNVKGTAPLAPELRRMPAIVRREDYDAWLGGTPAQARAVLVPYPSQLMIAWPVGTRVNSPRNDDATLIEPLPQRSVAR